MNPLSHTDRKICQEEKMEIVLEYNLFYISFIATILIAFLVMARIFLGRRIHRIFFSLAWMIVLLRLILPLCVTIPVDMTKAVVSGYEWVQHISFARYIWVWGAGALVTAVFFCARYVMSGRMLREAVPIQKVPDIDEEMFTFMGIKVYVSDRISSPVTYGIFKQKVLLPKYYMKLTREQLKFILIHEKIHIDSHDNLNKFLIIAAVCIHWFNPFAWLMYIYCNRDLELACDEKVVRQVGEESREDYANVLISLADSTLMGKAVYSGFAGSAIKERIVMIMGYRGVRGWNYVLYAGLALFSMLVFALPVQSEEKMIVPVQEEINRETKEEELYDAVDVVKVIEEDTIGTKADVTVKTREGVSLRMKIQLRKQLAMTNGIFVSYKNKGNEWKAGIDSEYEGTVTIPEAVRYKGKIYPVEGIGNYTFYRCRKLKKVVIPDTVSEIKEKAFYYCESLETLRMPAELELVEANPFIECTSLKAFEAPEEMRGQYRVKKGVLYTDYGRFLKVFPQGREKRKFVVNNNVSQIAESGFYGTKLEYIKLPKTMLRVKSRAFHNCRNLKTVEAGRDTVFSGDAFLGAGEARIKRYD